MCGTPGGAGACTGAAVGAGCMGAVCGAGPGGGGGAAWDAGYGVRSGIVDESRWDGAVLDEGTPGRVGRPGKTPRSCVRSRFGPGALGRAADGAALGAPPGPTLGLAMLGISWVPGTLRLMPPDESAPGWAARIEPVEGARATASTNAPRRESTLLIASGETCGPLLGSPTPGVVDASSAGTEGGGP